MEYGQRKNPLNFYVHLESVLNNKIVTEGFGLDSVCTLKVPLKFSFCDCVIIFRYNLLLYFIKNTCYTHFQPSWSGCESWKDALLNVIFHNSDSINILSYQLLGLGAVSQFIV